MKLKVITISITCNTFSPRSCPRRTMKESEELPSVNRTMMTRKVLKRLSKPARERVGRADGFAFATSRAPSARTMYSGGPQATMLGVYHDDPEVTEPAKLRSSACVVVPEGTEVSADIGSFCKNSTPYSHK